MSGKIKDFYLRKGLAKYIDTGISQTKQDAGSNQTD